MANREGNQREFKVGDRILIKLPAGNVSEGTIKAVIEETDGRKLQVAFGYDHTALIEEWQIIEE